MNGLSPLARNAVWNLFGLGIPLLVAAFAIPILIRGLGADRFGILAIAWTLLGYLTLFDLGVGRALTRSIATRRGAGAEADLPQLAGAALAFTLVLGAIGGGVLALAAPAIAGWLRTPAELREEMRVSLLWLAASLPFVLGTATLRGILEGYQRFGIANALRIGFGVYTFVVPLVLLQRSPSLPPIILALAAGRAAAWLLHLVAAWRVLPALRGGLRVQPELLAGLVRDGGWMTVTNIVGPIIVYSDRVLIAGMISTAAVAHYATPFELASRILVIPAALAGVLFPSFAAEHAAERGTVRALHRRGVIVTLLLVFPLGLVLNAFAPEILGLWIGPDFAGAGVAVLRWLSFGIVVNSVAHVPFALLQAAGHSDRVAKLHLIETPFALLITAWAIRLGGISFAAAAWSLRASIDAVALFVMARRPLAGAPEGASWLAALGMTAAGLFAVSLPAGVGARALVAATVLLSSAAIGWWWLLDAEDRSWMGERLRLLAGRDA